MADYGSGFADASGAWTGSTLPELIQTLIDVVAAQAGLIAIWHTGRGQVRAPVVAGLPAATLDELGGLLTTAAPDLLDTLVGARPGVARVGLLPDWQLDLASREARRPTRWGLLHVLALPVAGTPWVALLALLHPSSRLDLWTRRPHLLRLATRQIELELQMEQAHRRLLEEAHWLQAVLAQTAEGLVLVDADGRVLACNAAAERITGWRAADLAGRDLVATLQARPMYWADTGRTDDLWQGPLAAPPDADGILPGGARPVELVLTGRDGRQIYTEAGTALVAGDAGTVLGAVVSLRDVSAQREAEELQATFLSVISHELQTPLAIIRGYAELLADKAGTLPAAQVRKKLRVVAEESTRLSAMVGNLLDASRIGAGGLELQPEPINIPRLVRHAVQKVELLGPDHPFVIAIPDDLPPVLADYDRVSQVLINLLENAIKYSPRGGHITITADLTSDEVILHVSDEGIGVPDAERERIFSRFARLDSRVVRQMKGVGLGLYIARAIIRAHGGRIWVESAPGGGSTFSFSLPRQYKAPLPILFGRG